MTPTTLPGIAFRREASDIGDLALLALAVAGAVVAVLIDAAWIAVVAALPSLAGDTLRGPRPPRLRRLARRVLIDPPGRSLVRNGAVVVAIGATHAAAIDLLALLVATMAVHVGQVAYLGFAERVLVAEQTRMSWRNLDVAGGWAGPPPPIDPVHTALRIDGLRLLTVAEAPMLLGALVAAFGITGVPVALAVLTVAPVIVAVALAWRAWPPGRAPASPRDTDTAVADAVARLAPEVVFYFSSPASGTYALAVWAGVINAMRRPVLVVVREVVHLPALHAITAPLVVAPTVADLERVTTPSVRVVLYPTNVVRNNEMVRIPGPMHCFIGHGDSDKVGSFSPLNRMYDEIWVAGQAAIDRYGVVDEGIDPAALRAVGRPQLAEIRRAKPGGEHGTRLTVLYAPTWEGFFDEADYSSVAEMGERIVEIALAAGARVLFKAHPLTGHRLPAAGRALKAIESRVTRAGNGSAVVPNTPNALYAAFNDADLLITDISSVITDFLASRKPYVVTNRRDLPADEFVATFPSAGAAPLLSSSVAELPDALADAAGPDVRRAARVALAAHLLGDQSDPLAAFLNEVDDFVERQQARAAAGARA